MTAVIGRPGMAGGTLAGGAAQRRPRKRGDHPAPAYGHPVWKSKRLLGAMVLDRMDAESLSTWAGFPDRCQRLVNGLDSVNGLDL